MGMCWIDATGFHRLRLDEIVAQLTAERQSLFGADKDFGPESPDGQLIGIEAANWDTVLSVQEQIYNARSPDGSTGAALARLVRINGVTKKEPAYSTGTVTLGTSGLTAVPVGAGAKIANELDPTAIFLTQADVTIPGGGTVNVAVKATVTGAVPGLAGNLTQILTVINGWDSVTNASDVTLGDAGETDAQLRIRRAASVALPSQGILDGLRAAILQLPDVEQCVVRENPEDSVQTLSDGGTLAPHAIQVLVKSGDDQAIAEAIWLKKSSGVTLVGATEVTITDSQGVDHVMKFDRPADSNVYVLVNTPVALTVDQQTLVKKAIEDRGNGLLSINGVVLPGSQIGENVNVSEIYEAITYLRVTSMPTLKVDEIDISLTPGPTDDAELDIPFDHIATWNAARVTFLP